MSDAIDAPDFPPLSRGSALKETPRVHEVSFGDGFTQATPDGINGIGRNFTAVWRALPRAEASALAARLAAYGGWRTFRFTAPDDEPRVWRCRNWSQKTISANYSDLTAEFVEVPL